MTRSLVTALAVAFAVTSAGGAMAAPCKDAKGKFIKCPAAAAPAKPTKCKDAKGKFAKCGTPGAKPVK
jgi:hypothetical protein